MDKQEAEYIAGLAVKKHEGRFHKKPRAKQEKGRYDEPFEKFWKAFKGRWDTDKGVYIKVYKYEAWLEWQKLTDSDKARAASSANKVGGKYTPDAFRWLKKKMFDDYRFNTP